MSLDEQIAEFNKMFPKANLSAKNVDPKQMEEMMAAQKKKK